MTPTDVHYGPDIGTEADFRLLGNLNDKRVLELGCGDGPCSIAFARQGAHAIVVDASAERLASAQRRSTEEEVKVELRQGDLADLAFVRADSIDLAFSAWAFQHVDDLSRVFRQVHRVLKVGAPLVFSLPHPASHLVDPDSDEPLLVRRPYFDREPIDRTRDGVSSRTYHHTVQALVTGLVRSSYRVDTILEPEPVTGGPRGPEWRPAFRYVPRALVVRARKEGN